ncbi:hypothetical protein, partial [Yersinia hibernica]|uniref:hypothetical protein n=1 Tax=Yersinia hibernica TaxID=2339259 RepID=UPI001C956917
MWQAWVFTPLQGHIMTMLTKNKTEILNINITELYIASKKNLNKDEIVCNKQLKFSDTLSYISNS